MTLTGPGGLAARLASGAVTSVELVERARVCAVPGAVEQVLSGAWMSAREADARRAQGRALGPWDGVPFGVKANIAVAGVSTTAGTGVAVPPAPRHAPVVATLVRAGMIPALTTTLAEAAVGSVTDNPHTGPCASPRYPRLQAGGSSGGSGAVVAAGAVAMALGSDTMGSVRLPAAYCGVAALKPSRGALSTGGLVPLHRLLDTIGPMAARAEDLLALLPVLAPKSVDRPLPTHLTVGVPDFVGDSDREGQAAVETVVALLEGLGHRVVRDLRLDFQPDAVRRRGLLLCEVGGYAFHREAVDSEDPGISDQLRALFLYGARAEPSRVRAAHAELTGLSARIRKVMASVDVMLLPTTPAAPPLLGEDPPHAADFAAWVNVAGLPAVAFPGPGGTADAPPRGIQVVGSAREDAFVLAVASLIERELAGSR